MLEEGEATALAAVPDDGGPLVLFGRVLPPDFEVVIFGAGHVARALVPILATLPSRVHWIDERADAFPQAPLARNVRRVVSDDPVGEVAVAPARACFLVMTHSHALDEALAQAILARGSFRWFGLIGSMTKRRRFEHRLEARGIDAAALARMTCPIGIADIADKAPASIAVAVAAQLLRERERWRAAPVHDEASAAVVRAGTVSSGVMP